MSQRGRPPGITERGEATKDEIFDVATRLFAEAGFEKTTLRAIAAEAGVSPGLLYKYFPSKNAVVLELYSRLTETFATSADPIPSGGWPARFHFVLQTSLATLEPHRETLASVLPVLLADREAGLLSETAIEPRERVRERFIAAVRASDSPPGDAEALGRLLYLLQLGVLLWWVLDRSENQRATHELVDMLGEWGGTMSMALWLPGAAGVIRKLDDIATRALFTG